MTGRESPGQAVSNIVIVYFQLSVRFARPELDRWRTPSHSALALWIDQTVVGTLPTPAACATCAPRMNQIATSPFVSCQRMSVLPSPLKSPVSTIDHTEGGAEPTPADW